MMASKTFSGQLDQAMDELAAEGNKILFIPQQNVGEVLEGAASEMTVASDGTYSVKLAYNTYSIYHYSDVTKRKRLLADGIVVSSETSVTTIPGLIGSTVPVTEDSVLTIQGYLDEANEAKTDAEAAQTATEALFDDFDSNVAGAMALVHADTPSLSVPFNESGRLDYGVGTEYVSGLPVYGVDFTRSTSCYYINKSGLIDYADVDEIAIGKGGVLLEEASTNLLSYSQVCGTNWLAYGSGNATYSLNTTETTDPMGSYTATKMTQNVADDSRYGISTGITATSSGDVYTSSVFVKPDGIEKASLNLVILSGGVTEVSSYSITISTGESVLNYGIEGTTRSEYVGNGWYRISLTCTFSEPDNTVLRTDIGISSSETGTAYFYGAQVENKSLATSYIPTDGSSSSRASTSCTVPVSGNLPATGKSCTWMADANVASTAETNRALLMVSGTSTSGDFDGIVIGSLGVISFRSGDNGVGNVPLGNISNNSSYVSGGVNRFTIVYDADAETVTAYVNGNPNPAGEESVSGMTLPRDGNLYIGSSSGTWHINAQLKNFKILPYAASADEVKSWGAPK